MTAKEIKKLFPFLKEKEKRLFMQDRQTRDIAKDILKSLISHRFYTTCL